MSDISLMSVTELENRKRALDQDIDKIAMQLDEVNQELARRVRRFRALCVSPAGTFETRGTVGRQSQRYGRC